RDKHRQELAAIMNEFSRRLSRAELYHRSQARHIPAGPVLGINELADDPQLSARKFFGVRDSDKGPVRVARLPWTVNGVRGGQACASSGNAARWPGAR